MSSLIENMILSVRFEIDMCELLKMIEDPENDLLSSQNWIFVIVGIVLKN